MRRGSPPVTVTIAVTAGLLASGCLPSAVTRQGRDVASLYTVFVAGGVVIALLVWSLLLFVMIRYRGRRTGDADAGPEPPQTHGHFGLELVWTAIPAVTIAVLFVLTLGTLSSVQRQDPRPAVEVQVTGFRWGWTFDYPAQDLSVTATGEPGPEMLLPVGQPVVLTMTSADVQHAWYVPQFLIKHDLYPGRTARVDLLIEQPGTYGAQCAEFCGLLHDRMPFTVRAVPPEEFSAWVAERQVAMDTRP